MNDLVTISAEELSRAQVLQQLDEKRIKPRHTAKQLGISVRQVRRLLKAYRRDGSKALVSKQRGQPSNHQLNPHTKQEAVGLLRSRYADFGPTLAHEKLTEDHQLALGRESVRQLMIAEDLWQPKRAKKPVIHQLRERRARFGELVRIDGSPYAWADEKLGYWAGQVIFLSQRPNTAWNAEPGASRRGNVEGGWGKSSSITRVQNSRMDKPKWLSERSRFLNSPSVWDVASLMRKP